MSVLRVSWPLLLLPLLGCEDSVSGFLSCGVEMCSARQECVSSALGPTCVCTEGFVGTECTTCASGYKLVDNRCALIPLDCAVNPERCGPHGTCVATAGADECACEALYEGRLCDQCESGYQDNDANGDCRPTCAEAQLDCKAPSRCSDAGGTALCECPTGYTGDDCSRCALGYRDSANGCVPTCAASGFTCSTNQICVDTDTGARCECAEGYGGIGCASCAEGYLQDSTTGACLPSCDGAGVRCGEHGSCDDSIGFARCVCDLGYAGESCGVCATSFEQGAGGTCGRAPTASETLVMAGSFEGRPVLATLDPGSGSALPLAELEVTGLSGGATPRALFVNRAGSISSYALATGAVEDAVDGSGAVGPLAWDGAANRLYALGGPRSFPLLSIDPAAKTVVPRFETGLAGAVDLAFDAANQRVLVLRDTLFAVSLADGAVTELAPLPPATLGIEIGADGALLALSATDADEAAARVQACRSTAAALGLDGYAGATGRFVQPDSDVDQVTLAAATPDKLEVQSYLGRGGDSAPRTVQITADNPDVFLCLALEEATLVSVAAGARFRALVIYAADDPIELQIEDGFAGGAVPLIHLGGYAPVFTRPDREDIVVYTPEEWAARGLAVDPRFHRPGPGVLHTLDGAFSVRSSVPLSGGVLPGGPLARWEPVAP
ncbi:hypothetical protein [Sorangium sp. So ce204]|uniref:hypothetical protein n=1 Tax=Sorangium sp. So ce204 TaxID=3133288 RepID=UPI003F63EBD8